MYLRSRFIDLTSTSQDGGNDVISHRKVLPPGASAHNVFPASTQQRPPVPDL